MILKTFIAVNSAILVTRAINTKIDESMREKILSDGLYHVTTEENADKIMRLGHIKPSSNLLSLGSKKCFFFAGLPSYKDLASNCASEASKYEFKAIKIMPNAEELSKFKQRSFNDDSITYKGKCELPDERTKIVDLVLDIDDKGNIYTREKTQEELEKQYIPSDELVKKMKSLAKSNVIGVMGKAYISEYKTVGRKISTKLSSLKDILMGKKQIKLPKGNSDNVNYGDIQNDSNNIIDDLGADVFDIEEIYGNYNQEKNESEISVESKERV